MIKIRRRAMLRTMGVFSLGGVLQSFVKDPLPGYTTKAQIHIETDILVVGGGTAGIVAALQAARAGCSTIIVENGSQLGGTMTTGGVSFPGLFYAWGKQVIGGIGWDLVRETVRMNDDELPDFSIPFGTNHPKHHVRINGYLYALLAEEKCLKEGVTLRYYETPVSILPSKNGWEVETIGKGTHARIFCKQLIDCTGNAFAASMAGFELLREEETQPGSLMFRLEGYDLESLDLNRIREQYDLALQSGELRQGDASIGITHMLGKRGDNAQHIFGADSSTSELHSMTNIEGRASLLRMLRFLRRMPGCEQTYIASMQTESGVRETYRIDALYNITHNDYVTGKIFEDAVSWSYYPIDLHDENGVVPKHLGDKIVASIPLRSLVPKESRNFIVAGRCLGSDRLANSALRVQASCMGMGQAAGAAAALACQHNTTPSEVPVEEVRALIIKHGGIVPEQAGS